MENKEIRNKSRYLLLIRENYLWKNGFDTLYSITPDLEFYKISDMYKKFTKENEKHVDNIINFTLENVVDKREKELLEDYFGLFKDSKNLKEIAKEQNSNQYFLSHLKEKAMRRIKHKFKHNKNFLKQKENIDNLIERYEKELISKE